jgi:uncharacterized protein YndB with AHSA1/START domain
MKKEKKTKQKIELEYTLNTSIGILFERLSTPSGLTEWFADDVNFNGNRLVFIWKGQEEPAEIINIKDNKSIRFKWLNDSEQKAYLEFRIGQDELTGDISLYITDFVEDDEVDEAINLWDTQISKLKHIIGL